MKARLLIVLTLVFWAGTSCQKKIDIAKEEAAIKAFFEKNKTDYFNGDYTAMSEAWVKDPSSVKMWISVKGLGEYRRKGEERSSRQNMESKRNEFYSFILSF
jgi:hypothetical protein